MESSSWKILAGVALLMVIGTIPATAGRGNAGKVKASGHSISRQSAASHGAILTASVQHSHRRGSIHRRHHGGYLSARYYGWRNDSYHGPYGYYGPWRHGRYYGAYAPYYPYRPYGVGAARVGALEADVKPGRAEILVDGEVVGQARDFNGNWDLLWLKPGTHILEFRRDGYQTLQIRVDVDAGSYYRIRQKMQKGEGLDPRSRELTAAQVEDPGPRDELPDRGVVADEGPVREDGTRAPAGPSGLAQGFLIVRALPEDASIYLDGRFLATARELDRLHGALPVAVGDHVVEVVRPGYRTVTERVVVSEGESSEVEIRLRRAGGGGGAL